MQESIKILTTAIEELNIFTNSTSSQLTLGENGSLVAVKNSLLNRIVGFARPFLGLSSLDQDREQKMRIKQLKERILRLREIIQTHYPLLESFQKGTKSQRKFAAFALKTIRSYNDIVDEGSDASIKKLSFDGERRYLLLDKEIKGHPIVSHQIKVGFDFPSSVNPAQQVLKQLNKLPSHRETRSNAMSPTYKKNNQFIIDSFRVKTRMMIQKKFSQENSSSEFPSKFAEGEIQMKEEQEMGRIRVEQHIKDLDSGSVSILSACFQLPHAFMPIPTLLELKWEEDTQPVKTSNEMIGSKSESSTL